MINTVFDFERDIFVYLSENAVNFVLVFDIQFYTTDCTNTYAIQFLKKYHQKHCTAY